jgi:lauroyl/myristoyl acyltransferase
VSFGDGARRRLEVLRLAPDGRPRPDAPIGRGPVAARLLGRTIRVASALVGRLPAGATHALARAGGTVEWAARPAKRRVLAQNLGHALGHPPGDPAVRRLVRREVVNEARRSVDFLWAVARPDELRRSTEVDGAEHIFEALESGSGLILASPHLGGWEVAAPVPAAVVPVPTTVLVTDDWLAWAVAGTRRNAGLRILYDTEPPMRLVDLLRRGEALLVLGDYAKPEMRTHRVRMLDAEVELPAGMGALSRLAGAPILPFAVLPLGPRRWRVTLEPAIPAPPRDSGREGERAALQALADRWTATIRAHPEHWAMVYPMSWHGRGDASHDTKDTR